MKHDDKPTLDALLAKRVHQAVAEINRAIHDAQQAGLEVRFSVLPINRMGAEHEECTLAVRVSRSL